MPEPHGLDIGGQAVIEGVMIKNRQKLAVAVRLENGQIKVKKEHLKTLPKFFKLPFVRGSATLIHIFIIGIRALMWSANQQMNEDEELTTRELVGILIVSLGFGMLFFVGIPFVVSSVVGAMGLWFNVLEGAVRVALFVGYIYAISFMKDIHRMFQYHGAEHMAVHCHEAKLELTVDNVRKFSPVHPRCGTSFIMLVLAISIIMFTFIHSPFWYVNLIWRIALVPVVAGIAYEILRLGGRFKQSKIMNIIIAPGKWVQKITTQQPDDSMIEVAIVAVKKVVE